MDVEGLVFQSCRLEMSFSACHTFFILQTGSQGKVRSTYPVNVKITLCGENGNETVVMKP